LVLFKIGGVSLFIDIFLSMDPTEVDWTGFTSDDISGLLCWRTQGFDAGAVFAVADASGFLFCGAQGLDIGDWKISEIEKYEIAKPTKAIVQLTAKYMDSLCKRLIASLL
jgi:hypothetical protein